MKNLLILVFCIVGLIGTAQSQSLKSKWSAGIDYGSAKVQNQTTEAATSFVSRLGGSVSITQSSSISNFRIYGGYTLDENLGFELGYNNTSDVNLTYSGTSGSTYSNRAYSGNIGMKYTGFDYSALIRPSISSGWNNMFFRVGMHNLDAKVSGTIAVSTTSVAYSSTTSGSGPMIGIGYDTKVSDDIDLRAQYTRLTKVAGVSGSDSNMYMIGVRKSF
jgi:hypothetical protein